MKQIITSLGTVVLQPDTTIDISKNNPLFTHAEEFSINLTVPRLPNEHIFGTRYRMASVGTPAPLRAQFRFFGREKMSGSIDLIAASKDSYEITLKGSRNDFIFRFGAQRLSEIDFGSQLFVPNVEEPTSLQVVTEMVRTLSGQTDWITFPVYNEVLEQWINKWSFDTGMFMLGENEFRTPFMRLYRVLEDLFALKGYTISSNWFADTTEKKNIVIYNCATSGLQFAGQGGSGEIFIKNLLPDWTITDFLNQIEDYFPVTIWINSRNMTVDIFSDDNILSASPVASIDKYLQRDYKINFEIEQSGYDLKYDLPKDDDTISADWDYADQAFNPEEVNTPADLLLPGWGGRLKLVLSTGQYYLAQYENNVLTWINKASVALSVRSGAGEIKRESKIYPLLGKSRAQREVVTQVHPDLQPERIETDFTLVVPNTKKPPSESNQDFRPMIYRGLDPAISSAPPGYTVTYLLYPMANYLNRRNNGARWPDNTLELRWDGEQGLNGAGTINFLDGAQKIDVKLVMHHIELESIDLTKVYTMCGRKVIISELVAHYGSQPNITVDAVLIAYNNT